MSQSLTSGINYAGTSNLAYANADPRAFFGIVETTVQALRLAYAARQGVVPRIIRRLSRKERKEWIVSGAVFVFDVKESGIQRWTDGRLWTPSRIVGNFLVYREMKERSGSRGHIEECAAGDTKGIHSSTQTQRRRRRSAGSSAAADEGLKIAGLMKKTITIRIHDLDYHLISYYTQEDLDLGRFNSISSRSDLMALDLPPQAFHFLDFRHPPRPEVTKDGLLEIVCDPEPMEPSVNYTESVRNDYSTPLEEMDGVVEDANGWDWAPVAPSAALAQAPGMVTPSGQNHRDSWQQEQYDSTEAVQRSSQQIYRSSSVPIETHLGYSHNNLGGNRQASVYPLQVWSSPSPPNHSTYIPAASNSDADLHNFQMRIHETTRTDEGSSASGSGHGNGGTRHVGQSQPIWLPANQNTVLRGSNSGAPYIHPSSSFYTSATHHAYGLPAPDRDSSASVATLHYPLDYAATLGCASQSTSPNPQYASIPCSQSYDIDRDEYEYYQPMQG